MTGTVNGLGSGWVWRETPQTSRDSGPSWELCAVRVRSLHPASCQQAGVCALTRHGCYWAPRVKPIGLNPSRRMLGFFLPVPFCPKAGGGCRT